MTSLDRHEIRYQRRRKRREMHRQQRSDALGALHQVFSYGDMFQFGRQCCRGVRWKQSVQNFELHLFSGTAARRRKLLAGKLKLGRYVHFTLTERGKTRAIDAPHINDRQIHKTLCNNALIPLYAPSMIYDNGASQLGKGLHFAHRRLADQLRWHFRRHGREGAVFLMDFHDFFPSAPHAALYDRHKRLLLNPDICAVADSVIATVPDGRGMPLGVEPSQQEMVAMPSKLDNYIKCQLGIHGAGHYMDDYYMLLPSVKCAKQVAGDVIRRAEALGLQVNRAKCHIIRLDKTFRYCKIQFQLTETGAVKTHGCRAGMKRARRKLKAFKPRVDAGTMPLESVKEFLQSQTAYYKNYNDHGRVLRLRRLYQAIFGGEN